jgi:hypothetical protein
MHMAAGMYVKVPEELAESLAEDGFRMAGVARGIELYAETILAASANLVTVFVGRHEIARFVAHLLAPLRGGNRRTPDGLRIVVERGGQRVAIALAHEGFSDAGPPQALVHGMTALLEALAETENDRSAVG